MTALKNVSPIHFLTAFALMLCMLSASGCKKTSALEATKSEETNPAEVTVTPNLSQQLRIGEPQMNNVVGSLQVSARVENDATRIARVGSPVTGRITKLLALEGQSIRRGAVLAMLHSTDLSDTQFSYLKAYSQETLAEQATKRAEQLVAADVFGRAELERRRAELMQASAEEAALRTQLRGLGMSEESIQRLQTSHKLNADYPILSSIGGTVLERKVTIGQIVQPAELAFLVADLSNVWIHLRMCPKKTQASSARACL